MSNKTTVAASHIPNPAQAADTVGEMSQLISEPELEFFNRLSADLDIKLTTRVKAIAGTLNLRASPKAKVASLRLRSEVMEYVNDEDDEEDEDCESTWGDDDNVTFRDLTPEELDRVVIRGKRIRLRGLSGDVVSHDAPNGEFFTVRELLQAVEETERQTRDRSKWFGGIDVHHCYFEGMRLDKDGSWHIRWGS